MRSTRTRFLPRPAKERRHIKSIRKLLQGAVKKITVAWGDLSVSMPGQSGSGHGPFLRIVLHLMKPCRQELSHPQPVRGDRQGWVHAAAPWEKRSVDDKQIVDVMAPIVAVNDR